MKITVKIEVQPELVARAISSYTDEVGKVRSKKIAVAAIKRFIKAYGCERDDDAFYDRQDEKGTQEWLEGLLWGYAVAKKYKLIKEDPYEYTHLKIALRPSLENIEQ